MPELSTPADHTNIRRAAPADFDAIADAHCDGLPHDILPRLGRRALVEVFYPWFLSSHLFDFSAFVADDAVAGFIVLRNRRIPLAELVSTSTKLLRVVAWHTLAHPSLALACACYLLRTRTPTPERRAVRHSPHKEIVVMAVGERWQRMGVGSALLARCGGDSEVVGVITDSEAALAFYLAQNFAIIGHERRCRRTLYILARPVQRSAVE